MMMKKSAIFTVHFQRCNQISDILFPKSNDNSESLSSSSEELTANISEVSRATEQVSKSMFEISTGASTQESFVFGYEKASWKYFKRNWAYEWSHFNNSRVFLNYNRKTQIGAQSISSVISQMGLINTKTDESIHIVEELNKKSKEIIEIINMISDIARQTNLCP